MLKIPLVILGIMVLFTVPIYFLATVEYANFQCHEGKVHIKQHGYWVKTAEECMKELK